MRQCIDTNGVLTDIKVAEYDTMAKTFKFDKPKNVGNMIKWFKWLT